jgi:hypothetical protein
VDGWRGRHSTFPKSLANKAKVKTTLPGY